MFPESMQGAVHMWADRRGVCTGGYLSRSPRASKVSFSFAFSVGFAVGSDSKETACNVGDQCSVPGLGRSPGEGNGYPLRYSCLENCMDRGAWWGTVHGSDTTEWLTLLLSLAFSVMELELWNIFKKWHDPQILVVWFTCGVCTRRGFPGGSAIKNLPCSSGDAGDMGLIPGSDPWIRKIPWGREWLPTAGYCLENSTRRGVHDVQKSWPWRVPACTHTYTPAEVSSCFLIPSSVMPRISDLMALWTGCHPRNQKQEKCLLVIYCRLLILEWNLSLSYIM